MGVNFYLQDLIIFIEWELLSFIRMRVIILLLLDWIRLLFISFVLFISSMVLVYRYYYIEGDKYLYRFIVLVYLFVCSILLIILRPNIIRILLGWDGLGLVSYCLVIYYQGVKSANAGILTILSNRVGDVAILLRISWLLNYGSWNFFYFQYYIIFTDLQFVFCIIILAAITKRAQIPFSAWLPAAMAAPTPVSALVHSSTLVTAGVYLLIRFNVLLDINIFIIYIGCITIFISGLGANLEIDLKKIIALSTLRQLGVIIFILSLGHRELAFFHLLSHALFKSLLFLCAGVFIHGFTDSQDIRFIGGVVDSIPISSFFFIACSLSLCGFPFLSGFYSKDLILEIFIIGGINLFLLLIVCLGTFFTIRYSVRLGIFLYLKNLGVKLIIHFSETLGIIAPMGLLFLISIFAGRLLSWVFFPCYFIFLIYFFKLLFLVIFFIIFYYIYLVINRRGSINLNLTKINIMLFYGGIWFIPILSTRLFIKILVLGKIILNYIDQGWMEFFGGQGLIKIYSVFTSKLDFSLSLGLKMYTLSFLLFIFMGFYLF